VCCVSFIVPLFAQFSLSSVTTTITKPRANHSAPQQSRQNATVGLTPHYINVQFLHQTPQTSHCSFKRQYIIEFEQRCPNGDVNIAAELIQTSQLAFCTYFTVSLLVAIYTFFDPNRGFTLKTNSHLHDRNDPTADGPTNTTLYCTWVTHWFH